MIKKKGTTVRAYSCTHYGLDFSHTLKVFILLTLSV